MDFRCLKEEDGLRGWPKKQTELKREKEGLKGFRPEQKARFIAGSDHVRTTWQMFFREEDMSLKDLERYKEELERLKEEFRRRENHPAVRSAIAQRFQLVLGEILRQESIGSKNGGESLWNLK